MGHVLFLENPYFQTKTKKTTVEISSIPSGPATVAQPCQKNTCLNESGLNKIKYTFYSLTQVNVLKLTNE